MNVEHYIGIPWVAGETDCWNFARKVWREQFNLKIDAVDVDAASRLRAGRAFSDHPEWLHWKVVGQPEDGDGVAMGKSNRVSHVGIWIDNGVLHSIQGRGVIHTKLGALQSMGLRVLHYYRRVECKPRL